MVCGRKLDQLYMVMEYAAYDIKRLLVTSSASTSALTSTSSTQFFHLSHIKSLMYDLFSALAYLHEHYIIHRDIKTSNLLYNDKGELKLCDFGMARRIGSPVTTPSSSTPQYTPLVCTLWYRAPELLMGALHYHTPIDMWSAGCVMGELFTGKALFMGRGEMDQLSKIMSTCGTPTVETYPDLVHLPHYQHYSFPMYESMLRGMFAVHSVVYSDVVLDGAGYELF